MKLKYARHTKVFESICGSCLFTCILIIFLLFQFLWPHHHVNCSCVSSFILLYIKNWLIYRVTQKDLKTFVDAVDLSTFSHFFLLSSLLLKMNLMYFSRCIKVFFLQRTVCILWVIFYKNFQKCLFVIRMKCVEIT